tara:strand:+ start:387 stop:1271 length:885 start_codon:yes stop_codon:yes gene_type:complete
MDDVYEHTKENDHHKIVKCSSCNHIQLFPLDIDLKEYYDHDKQDKHVINIGNRERDEWLEMVNSQSEQRMAYLSEIIDLLLKTKNEISVCDIGGGYGHFCRNMKNKYKEKVNVTLIEPGTSRINKYLNEDITVIESFLNEDLTRAHSQKYDLVTCFHVFEHVFEPKKFIVSLRQLVKNDGYYCIEVPNHNNELLELCETFKKKVWYINCHISYFTPKIFLSLLTDENNILVKMRGFERYGLFNFLYWLYYNEPQKGKVNYFNGKSLHEIEDSWIENRNKNMMSDSIYAIVQKIC